MSARAGLRTRIAAVLYERSVRRAGLDFKWATLTQDAVKQSWLDDADAVIRELSPQLTAWARACVSEGDMTPAAERQLHNILGEYDSDG